MGLLEQQLASGLLNQPATANPKMLAQALKARQQPRTQLTGQGLLDTAAIGLSPVPVIGDALGLAADASRFYNEPESRTPLNFGLAALGAIPFIPPLVSMGLGKFAQSQGKTLSAPSMSGPAKNQAGAIVYHGSPHKFDQFDSSKIGTGEGAQAYGHGLYFAESPEVAKSYQKLGEVVSIDGKPVSGAKGAAFSAPDGMSKTAVNVLGLNNWNVKSALDDLGQSYSSATSAADKAYYMDLIRQIKQIPQGKIASQGGSLYKVDLPDEAIAKMLDWDAPLNKQPAEVRTALKNLGITVDDRALSSFDDALLSALSGGPTSLPKQPLNPAGESVYKKLGGADTAAKKLKEQGIPGIRYLDGGSRNVGEGTRNFVVFPGNEGLLKILERQ